MRIRVVKKSDLERMIEIYAPSILNNSVSFEYVVPSKSEFQKRITTIARTYPWLVCEHQGEVIGYAYASPYRDRAAYQWSCECSVYVDSQLQRKGVAKILYATLFDILAIQGFVNVYAVITHPNPASIKLHESCGFKKFAVYKKVGYKRERWHDVLWLAKRLNAYSKKRIPPVLFSKIKNDDRVNKIIKRHNLRIFDHLT